MAGHMRAAGDAAGEARVLARQSAFVPTGEVYAALKDATRRAGDEQRLALLADQEARLRAVMARPAGLRAQGRAALARAVADGDAALTAIVITSYSIHYTKLYDIRRSPATSSNPGPTFLTTTG